jgi:hypothetical protein
VSITPQATVSVTPPITPSRSPLTITALYYNNSEYNDGGIFLDGNLAVNQNGGNIVNEVFTTPGDVLYTGGKIFQDDSIFAQASGNTTAYPKPIYGTSTRRLLISDSAGNTINDTTVDYNSSTNRTFSVVGGRTYFVRGFTNYTYPVTATLFIVGLGIVLVEGQYYYAIGGGLSAYVDGSMTIKGGFGQGISGTLYDTSDCSFGFDISSMQVESDFTMNRGFADGFFLKTGTLVGAPYSSYQFTNYVVIDHGSGLIGYSNGQTFVVGNTTVTVSIDTNCNAFG